MTHLLWPVASIVGHILLLFLQFSQENLEYGPLVDPCFSVVETFEFAASIEEEGTVSDSVV